MKWFSEGVSKYYFLEFKTHAWTAKPSFCSTLPGRVYNIKQPHPYKFTNSSKAWDMESLRPEANAWWIFWNVLKIYSNIEVRVLFSILLMLFVFYEFGWFSHPYSLRVATLELNNWYGCSWASHKTLSSWRKGEFEYSLIQHSETGNACIV